VNLATLSLALHHNWDRAEQAKNLQCP